MLMSGSFLVDCHSINIMPHNLVVKFFSQGLVKIF